MNVAKISKNIIIKMPSVVFRDLMTGINHTDYNISYRLYTVSSMDGLAHFSPFTKFCPVYFTLNKLLLKQIQCKMELNYLMEGLCLKDTN